MTRTRTTRPKRKRKVKKRRCVAPAKHKHSATHKHGAKRKHSAKHKLSPSGEGKKASHKRATCKPAPKHKKKHKRKHHPKTPPATSLTPLGGGPGSSQPAPPIGTGAPSGSTPGPVPAPTPTPPPPSSTISSPIAKYRGAFGTVQAERLLWRAGFGPKPGEIAEVAAMGLDRAVMRFTRPQGAAVLTGPAPTDRLGNPLEPYDLLGHDQSYWLDRMLRSDQQLVERMSLVLHDWFATSFDGVNNQKFMVEQTNVFRTHALGSFKNLVHDISRDNAMIIWLSLFRNVKGRVNENYARELMELFTLGADRGAYTEADIREIARALSGWAGVWDDQLGYTSFYWDPAQHDDGLKTVFGKTGNYDWTDIARMVIQHPMHPSFFVTKLWSYFIPTPPPPDVVTALANLYLRSDYQIRPVLEAILCSPQFYSGPPMVKPPVVYQAGLMRALGVFIKRTDWYWYSMMAGQRLYWPPDVSGWNDKRWLDTNTLRARWVLAAQVFLGRTFGQAAARSYDATETPAEAVTKAIDFWGAPTISDETRAELLAFATAHNGTPMVNAQRQNILRQIIPCLPDYLTC